MSAPFVYLFVSFAAGVLSQRFLHFPEWVLIVALAAAVSGIFVSNFKIAIAANLVFLFLLAATLTQQDRERYGSNELRTWVRAHEKEVVPFEGTLMRTPELSGDYFVLQVKIENVSRVPIHGVARLTVSGDLRESLIAGDRIESFARLRLPKNFRTPGAFDYEQFLQSQNIHVLGSIKNSRLIHKKTREKTLRGHFSAVRSHLIRNTIRNFEPADAGLLRALWLDDRGGLNPSQERILVDAGVFHVIAISGFHISVLLLIMFFALKRFVSFRFAVAVACVLLLGYYVILEGRSSVTRSFLSFLILAFAIWKYEQIRLANWICLSAFIQIALNPQELYDSGFHLTYLSTAVILFLVVPVCRLYQKLPPYYRYPLNFVTTGVIVQLALIPYQIYVFHRIPIYSFFANLVAVPVSSALIATSMFIMPSALLSRLLRIPVQASISGLMSSANLFADSGALTVPSPPVALVLIFYASLALFAMVRFVRWKLLYLIASCLLFAVILIPRPVKPSGDLRVHFLDVGQGDAILLEYPDATFDLVDAGGFMNQDALDTGQAILLPCLSRMGVTRLNRVFLTHAHADHMSGLASLMRYFPVNHLYVTRRPVGVTNYSILLKTILRSPETVSHGHRFSQAGVSLEVLSPDDSRKTNSVANDDSLVLLVEYRGKSLLLTGDIEREREEVLSVRIPGTIDYLKVPHHGSKTSSSVTFLETLHPRVAFISVGSNNWFGHPDPGVVSRYRSKHVLLYRTDLHGTITLRIGENGPSIETYQ